MEEKVLVRNDALIDKVLAYIEEHPQDWNQESWFCKTDACFAGHTLLLSGYRIVDPTIEKAKNAHLLQYIGDVEMVNPEGLIISDYADRARELLGLDGEGSSLLFDGNISSIEELRDTIDHIRTKS